MDRTLLFNSERMKEKLDQSDLDGIVVHSPHNLPYFSGFYNLDLRLTPEYLNMAIWTKDGQSVFIGPRRGPGFGPVDPTIEDKRLYHRELDDPMRELASVLDELALEDGRIGMELDSFPASSYLALVDYVPGASLVECNALLSSIKAVKTPAEIEILRSGAYVTAKAIRTAFEMAREGDTEKSVVDNLSSLLLRLGADAMGFNVAASGERTMYGHHLATTTAIRSQDLYRVDIGGIFSGYLSDIARTFVVGQPLQRQEAIYMKCVEVHNDMLQKLRPGAVPKEIVKDSLEHYRKVGLEPNRSLFGHSIGFHVHERPFLDAHDDMILEEGMVLCVENGWSDEENAERYHIEDTFLITYDGLELFSDYGPIEEFFQIATR